MRSFTRICLVALGLAFIATPAHAVGSLDPVEVFSDAVGDGPIGGGVDSYQDLVGGAIAETDTSIIFTWIVDDLPDPLAKGMPSVSAYFWEFSLTDATGDSGRFSLRVNYPANPNSGPSGSLAGEPCTTTGTLIQCTNKPANITVSVDSIADTISASIRRKDLKGESGRALATDGAVLEQQTLFQGIAAYTAVPGGILTPGATGDTAAMDDIYILGTPR